MNDIKQPIIDPNNLSPKEPTPTEKALQPKGKRKKRSLFARLLRGGSKLLTWLFLLLLLLVIVFRIPAVQEWTIQKITHFLSSELKTTVQIAHFQVDYFDVITLGSVYIADQKGDTLIFAKELVADFRYWKALQGKIQFDGILLRDGKIVIKRDSGQATDNMRFIADYFDPPSDVPPTPKKPTNLVIGHLQLRDNFHFRRDDKVRGQILDVQLTAADIHTNFMNLPKQIINLREVKLARPIVSIENYPENPLADTYKESVLQTDATLPKDSTKAKEGLQFGIGVVHISDGTFKLDNFTKSKKRFNIKNTIDFNHLNTFDIQLDIHSFLYSDEKFTGAIDLLSCQEQSGFVLTQLSATSSEVSSTFTQFDDLQIITPYSKVGNSFSMSYERWQDFLNYNDAVFMRGAFRNSKIMFRDIMAFAPDLESNQFFTRNRNEIATIDGDLAGTVNFLSSKNLHLKLGNNLELAGNFKTRNIAVRNEENFTLKFDKLKSDITSLRQLLPDFTPPEDVNKFGKLEFEGSFEGFINSFVLNGDLKTEIGRMNIREMQLNARDGNANATYKGKLSVQDFDIARWTGNNDFGKVSVSANITNGKGILKNRFDMDLSASVERLTFKNYEYRNTEIKGHVNPKSFAGSCISRDPNADFDFQGTIDFADAATNLPVFKFKTNIRNVYFKKLNLGSQDLALAVNADLHLTGAKWSQLSGEALIRDIILVQNQVEKHVIKNITFKTGVTEGGKTMSIDSDILTANISGKFDLDQMHEAILQHFIQKHPRLTRDLGLKVIREQIDPQQFDFDIRILNTKNLTKLFDNKLDTLKNISFIGNFNNINHQGKYKLDLPYLRYNGELEINDIALDWDILRDSSLIDLRVYSVNVGKTNFGTSEFFGQLIGDSLNMTTFSENFSPSLKMKNLEFDVTLSPYDSLLWQVRFKPQPSAKLSILNDFWTIDSKNSILLGKSFIKLDHFKLFSNMRSITLQSKGNRGLNADIENFDISIVNKYIKDERFILHGIFNARLTADDIFKQKGMKAIFDMDTFKVQNNSHGVLQLEATMADLKSPIKAHLTLTKNSEQISIKGAYYLEAKDTFAANSLEAKVGLVNFPFKALQYLVTSGISDVSGVVSGDVKVFGQIPKINTLGALRLQNSWVTVDLLKTKLNVRDATVRIDNQRFDATGGTVFDAEGNPAKVTGGLTHDHFLNFGLDARVQAERFLCMNTTRTDNPLFYGRGIGKGDITFSGNFEKTDIRVRARMDKTTKIVFPFASEQNASAVTFIKFKNKQLQSVDTNNITATPNVTDLRGVALDMDLELTSDAECNLIFDENYEDNIKSWGEGNIQISLPRAGNLRMNGEYRIIRGDYLFTLARVVNKEFKIKRGGFIRWNGSPFDAQINIDAEYKSLSAAPYNFIAEYLSNTTDNITNDARRLTPIQLDLNLSGAMLKPDVGFKLGFPKLASDLKNYTDNKLRALERDPNELSRQVFGLIVMGSFVPSNELALSSQLTTGVVNTAIESVSAMLNRTLSDYVKGVDLQIGYNILQYDKVNDIGRAEHQFRLRVTKSFLDDRLTISGGAGVENNVTNPTGGDVFVGGDASAEYLLTPDRRLRIRVSYIYDQVLDGRRQRPAIGIRYRREFDNIRELFK